QLDVAVEGGGADDRRLAEVGGKVRWEGVGPARGGAVVVRGVLVVGVGGVGRVGAVVGVGVADIPDRVFRGRVDAEVDGVVGVDRGAEAGGGAVGAEGHEEGAARGHADVGVRPGGGEGEVEVVVGPRGLGEVVAHVGGAGRPRGRVPDLRAAGREGGGRA